jgi:hypothetical protein
MWLNTTVASRCAKIVAGDGSVLSLLLRVLQSLHPLFERMDTLFQDVAVSRLHRLRQDSLNLTEAGLFAAWYFA